ncbi:MAG TPA: DNA topoisomerase I, partial [Rhodospirillaceae bacterium]|nr:DNA topoisomerase I [Rhodospirillaceae bacterium]
EAHEAIRPTDPRRTPDSLSKYLSAGQLKLYELIWKRTIASQMEAAIMDQVAVIMTAPDGKTQLRANGSTIVFKGFLEAYDDTPSSQNTEDAVGEPGASNILPPMNKGQTVSVDDVKPEQHFTQPPP